MLKCKKKITAINADKPVRLILINKKVSISFTFYRKLYLEEKFLVYGSCLTILD